MKRLVALCLLLILLACVPTPEEEIVSNKTEGRLEAKISDAAPVAAYTVAIEGGESNASDENALQAVLGAPAHLEDSVSGKVFGGTMDVVIDADVSVPNVAAVPVYRVAIGGFTAEEKQRLTEELLGNGPYVRPSTNERVYVENQIRYAQSLLNALDSHPYGADVDDSQIRNRLTQLIEWKQEEYRNAADRPQKAWEGSFDDADVSVGAEGGFSLGWRQSNPRWCILTYQRPDDATLTFYVDPQPRAPRSDTEQKAIATATAFLQKLRSTDLQLYGIAAADEDWRQTFDVETGIENGILLMQFLPTYSGIPVYQQKTFHGTDNGLQEANVHYDMDAEQETIKCITEYDTVLRVDWKCPAKVLGTENENVELLPFDRIMDVFRQQIFMNIYMGHDSLGNDTHTTLYIAEIRFSYMRIRQPDSETYWLLPVWDFLGYDNITVPDARADWMQYHSLLTVNAVDGSIIDRDLGY